MGIFVQQHMMKASNKSDEKCWENGINGINQHSSLLPNIKHPPETMVRRGFTRTWDHKMGKVFNIRE